MAAVGRGTRRGDRAVQGVGAGECSRHGLEQDVEIFLNGRLPRFPGAKPLGRESRGKRAELLAPGAGAAVRSCDLARAVGVVESRERELEELADTAQAGFLVAQFEQLLLGR